MKVAVRNQNNGGGASHAAVRPPIPLIQNEETKKKTDEILKFKLFSTPGKKESALYECQVFIFWTGTSEEFIKAVMSIEKVCKGQSITKAKDKYALARRIFLGEALTAFNNAAKEANSVGTAANKGEETLENYDIVIKQVASAVFPLRAYSIQKQAMRRFMRKPREMSIREYVLVFWKLMNTFNISQPSQVNLKQQNYLRMRLWISLLMVFQIHGRKR